MAKTYGQLLQRTRVVLPLGQAPKGFRRVNWLLVTGNLTDNVWVKTLPSDRRDGTVKKYA